MKKTAINLFLVFATFFAITACGGKEMNDPADGSNEGPSYRNESDPLPLRSNDTTSTGSH